MYKTDAEKICDVEVESECLLADYSNTYCRSIPLAKDPEDFEVVVEYSYIVNNTSPEPQTVEKVVWNFNGNNNDLT